jgi:aminoglycoside/choline kinase family phosphotransferase
LAGYRLENDIKLTPAQNAFIEEHIPGFNGGTWNVSLAGQAGSQRLFYRITEPKTGGQSYILVIWDGKDEDWPRFLSIPCELSPHIDVLPSILHHDDRHGLILEEDLGSDTIKIVCDRGEAKEAVESLYRRVIESLVAWHKLDIRLSTTIASRALDFETFMWETDYFARRFVVDFCGAERLLNSAWEKERKTLAAETAALPKTFVHRDFQSENILTSGGRIKFVDFQGARLGPPEYDLASLLYDPYCGFLDDSFVSRLYDWYNRLAVKTATDRRTFDLCAIQRLMQALGAYGNLSIHHGKTRYRAFVPVALGRLCGVLERLPEFPEMVRVSRECRDATINANAH